MSKKDIKFNASDVLGALCLESQRIVAAADAFAAGAPFPEPQLLKVVLERQLELCSVLIDFDRTAKAIAAEQQAQAVVMPRVSDTVN